MIAGIQLSSIKSRMQNVRDAQASLTRLASSGFRYVQLQWHAKTIPAPVLRDSLAENGMKAVSVQDYTHEVLADPEYYVDLAGTCGFMDVCVSGLPDDVVTVNDLRSFANDFALFLTNSFVPVWCFPFIRDGWIIVRLMVLPPLYGSWTRCRKCESF